MLSFVFLDEPDDDDDPEDDLRTLLALEDFLSSPPFDSPFDSLFKPFSFMCLLLGSSFLSAFFCMFFLTTNPLKTP